MVFATNAAATTSDFFSPHCRKGCFFLGFFSCPSFVLLEFTFSRVELQLILGNT